MLRSTTVVIEAEGRDKGGTFVLTEKPAIPATEWFIRAMQLLARSGADVPPAIMQQGAAGFVTLGVGTVLTGLGKAPWFEVKPLLDDAPVLRAVDTLLRIAARRARLLGLDAPAQLDIGGAMESVVRVIHIDPTPVPDDAQGDSL